MSDSPMVGFSSLGNFCKRCGTIMPYTNAVCPNCNVGIFSSTSTDASEPKKIRLGYIREDDE